MTYNIENIASGQDVNVIIQIDDSALVSSVANIESSLDSIYQSIGTNSSNTLYTVLNGNRGNTYCICILLGVMLVLAIQKWTKSRIHKLKGEKE